MYGKLFESMYDGTLAGDWRGLVTFQQLIILCDADGTVDMTPDAISRRTSIPIEIILEGLKILECPDPNSRTPDDEGRRIKLIDKHRTWGWFIINHNKYKYMKDADTIREQNRERKRKQRKNEELMSQMSHPVTLSHAPSRHTDTDTNTDKESRTVRPKAKRKTIVFLPPDLSEIQNHIHEKHYSIDPSDFYNFYEAKDWMIGKNKMKSWKHALAMWESRLASKSPSNVSATLGAI